MNHEAISGVGDGPAAQTHELNDGEPLRSRIRRPSVGGVALTLSPKDVEFTAEEFGVGEGVIPLDDHSQHGRAGRSQAGASKLIGLAQNNGDGVDDLENYSGGDRLHGAPSDGFAISLPEKPIEVKTIQISENRLWRPARGRTIGWAATANGVPQTDVKDTS